jgi:hypothetical protein
MSEMVEVTIDSIRVSLMSQQRIVILREANADRYLAIWIGMYEAEAITLALGDVAISRPLTWDLLKSILTSLGGQVRQVEVVALRDDTFYGNIVLETPRGTLNIDSRPSDALALAVRTRVPIYVARSVMDSAGITPDEDLQQSQPAKSDKPTADTLAAPSDERLDVFADFFDKLNKDDSGEDQGDLPRK